MAHLGVRMLCGWGQLKRPNRQGITCAWVRYFIEPYEGICEIKGAPKSFAITPGWTLCDAEGKAWTIERLYAKPSDADGWVKAAVKRAAPTDRLQIGLLGRRQRPSRSRNR